MADPIKNIKNSRCPICGSERIQKVTKVFPFHIKDLSVEVKQEIVECENCEESWYEAGKMDEAKKRAIKKLKELGWLNVK